ncbi:hypothetical protein [Chachezhania sediminis]|uniref:hypothetical protein n=1 Tax=Chachezhania sediminis TaxID=2599291 RepID=UPI00131C663E|nr:hypothetical protein [Chachezhania sediminis]
MSTTAVVHCRSDGQIVSEATVENHSGMIADALAPFRDGLEIVGLDAGRCRNRWPAACWPQGFP